MLVFGTDGSVFRTLDDPPAPLVPASVLGDETEDAFRRSTILSRGSLSIVQSSSLVGTLTTLALLLAAWALITLLVQRFACSPERRIRSP